MLPCALLCAIRPSFQPVSQPQPSFASFYSAITAIDSCIIECVSVWETWWASEFVFISTILTLAIAMKSYVIVFIRNCCQRHCCWHRIYGGREREKKREIKKTENVLLIPAIDFSYRHTQTRLHQHCSRSFVANANCIVFFTLTITMKSNLLLNRSLAISMTHWRARALLFPKIFRFSFASECYGLWPRGQSKCLQSSINSNAIKKLHRHWVHWESESARGQTQTQFERPKKNKRTKIAFFKSNLSSSGCGQKFACVFWLTTAMSCASHTAQSALQNAETDLSPAIATNDGHTINWCMSTTRSHFISKFFLRTNRMSLVTVFVVNAWKSFRTMIASFFKVKETAINRVARTHPVATFDLF